MELTKNKMKTYLLTLAVPSAQLYKFEKILSGNVAKRNNNKANSTTYSSTIQYDVLK